MSQGTLQKLLLPPLLLFLMLLSQLLLTAVGTVCLALTPRRAS
jgi:hypothetical protein